MCVQSAFHSGKHKPVPSLKYLPPNTQGTRDPGLRTVPQLSQFFSQGVYCLVNVINWTNSYTRK